MIVSPKCLNSNCSLYSKCTHTFDACSNYLYLRTGQFIPTIQDYLMDIIDEEIDNAIKNIVNTKGEPNE